MILEDNLKLAPLVASSKEGVSQETSAEVLSIAEAIKNDVQAKRTLNKVFPQMHWDFYHAYQEKYFVQRKNEDNGQFLERKTQAIVTNYVRFIIDLDTRFLYGRPNKIGRQYGESAKTEKRMREVNKLINISNLQMESKRIASLYGEQGIRLIAVDKTTGSQVGDDSKLSDNVYPHPVPLDPRNTFFMVNPYDKITAVVIKTEFTDYVNGSKLVEATELITNDSRWLWYDDALESVELNKYNLRDEFVLQVNNPQRIDSVQDMLKLQTALNECMTDNKYFFAKHGRPQLVSSVDLSNVIGKGDTVWEINMDDSENQKVMDQLGFITWDGKMEASREHALELQSALFKVASTAAISTGDLKGIGNLRSGAALITAYAPSIQKALEQQIIWAANEEKLAFAIASFDALIHSTTVEERFPQMEFIMRFPKESGVPGEEIINAEVRQININSHLKTIHELVQDEHPEFSKAEVDAYRSQAVLDSRDLADATRAFEQLGGDEEKEKPKNKVKSSAKKSNEQTKSNK
jgi:hypothetical protein